MLFLKLTVVALVATAAVLLPLVTTAEGAVEPVRHDTEKTLFLIVEATQQNQLALFGLLTALTSVSNNINPNWFNQFVVISFDTSGIKSSAGYSTLEEARKALETIFYNPLSSNNGEDLPLLGSVIYGLSSFTFNPQSVVYLITTTGASVSDQANGPTFFKALLGWQVQLQYILINSTQGNHSLSTQSIRFVADLAVTTGGNFMELSYGSLIIGYISAHLPTLYDTAFIGDATQGSFSCVQTTYYAAVEPNVGTVYLYLYSTDAPVYVNDRYNDVSLMVLFEDGFSGIFSFSPVDGPGIYTVNVNGVGACSLQIRSQSTPDFPATTQIPNTMPTTSEPTTEALPNTSPSQPPSSTIVTTEPVATSVVSDTTPDESTATSISESSSTTPYVTDATAEVTLSSLISSTPPDTTTSGSVTTASTESVPSNSPVTDSTTIKTTSADNTESTPSGSTSSDTAASTVSTSPESIFPTRSSYYDAEFDIIFVLDIHSTSSSMILVNFLNSTLLNFNLNGQIHLAASGLCDYDPPEMFFLLIQGPGDIIGALSIFYNDCESFTGQSNLAGVLGELYNRNYEGYRPTINNHLIVYATNNGTAESDAIAVGNKIINKGTYSIVAVTSESNGNNIPSLTALVGGKSECVITANDWTTTAATKLATLIRKASNNNGVYC